MPTAHDRSHCCNAELREDCLARRDDFADLDHGILLICATPVLNLLQSAAPGRPN